MVTVSFSDTQVGLLTDAVDAAIQNAEKELESDNLSIASSLAIQRVVRELRVIRTTLTGDA